MKLALLQPLIKVGFIGDFIFSVASIHLSLFSLIWRKNILNNKVNQLQSN
jgi:hypothetical protein